MYIIAYCFEAFSYQKSRSIHKTKKKIEFVFPTWDTATFLSSDTGTHLTGTVILELHKALPLYKTSLT